MLDLVPFLGLNWGSFGPKYQFVLSSFFDTFADSKALVEFVPSNLTSFCVFTPFPVLSGPLSSLLSALSAGALIGHHK